MKILSFDAETEGLWGLPFAIGAVLIEDGKVTERFYARADVPVSNQWVRDNVLPVLPPATCESLPTMLDAFAKWYTSHKPGARCVTHMGYIVEAHLLRLMRDGGHIGDWDAPYPLYDVSGNLDAAGMDPTSVDAAATALGIVGEWQTHHPTDDAEVAGLVYARLKGD